MHDWLSVLPSDHPGGEGDAMRHAILLHRCFDGSEMRWSDALVARTRRHVGGCLTAVEMTLRLDLASAGSLHLNDLPDALCWARVRHDPALLGASLLAHMRDRAALGLMGQDHAFADALEESAPHLGASTQEALVALALAQAGWADAGPDETLLRADMPAEAMPELVWTAGAIIADALLSAGQPPADLGLIDRACSSLLARHDEHHMPFAQAALLAHRLRAQAIDDAQLLALARRRHVLALLGIAADRLGLELPCLVRHMVEGTEQTLFTLCRAAQFPREVAVRLVLGRRCVARGVDDSVLVDYADDYEMMTLAEARDALTLLGLSAPLRIRLAHVRARTHHGL
ncbi:MAG: hypothetical protein KA533_02655 [Sphingobium sp.]|nr:hypothetical protein [Sphingobium sp.]MBP6111494.1 hypothetical protein [Sphingobium sp.]MBP8669863.1 hypothetical protein [Sphingobium sp.]MBP9156376.1 hypothetical protein [Sphingobium sp.]MCC6483022.1 hypothetical protein [Sphingomonadaceae bacterium]